MTARTGLSGLLTILIWVGFSPPVYSQTLTLREAISTAEQNSPTAIAARERVAVEVLRALGPRAELAVAGGLDG